MIMNLFVPVSIKRDVESVKSALICYVINRYRTTEDALFDVFFSVHICYLKREKETKKRGKKLHY